MLKVEVTNENDEPVVVDYAGMPVVLMPGAVFEWELEDDDLVLITTRPVEIIEETEEDDSDDC
jgi:hypothetical protein